VKPPYDYIHQGAGYRYGVGWARIRIYAGESTSDAPVVLCSELPENAGEGMVERLAAEVVRDRFGDGLPELPRPLLWIEHVPPRRKGARQILPAHLPHVHPSLGGRRLRPPLHPGLSRLANASPLARSRCSPAKSCSRRRRVRGGPDEHVITSTA
jgi:hypothetical protein